MSRKDPNQASWGMTDAQIEMAFTKLTTNVQSEATKAVNRAAALYGARLKQNAPRQEGDKYSNGKYQDSRHSADYIAIKRARIEDGTPQAEVGFRVTKGLGWYMHFPDGGTVVRGTLHQPAQNFVEKTDRETVGPIKALFKYAVRKGFSK